MVNITEKPSQSTAEKILRWVQISNAKQNFLGNLHKIKRKHLQLYINSLRGILAKGF